MKVNEATTYECVLGETRATIELKLHQFAMML